MRNTASHSSRNTFARNCARTIAVVTYYDLNRTFGKMIK